MNYYIITGVYNSRYAFSIADYNNSVNICKAM